MIVLRTPKGWTGPKERGRQAGRRHLALPPGAASARSGPTRSIASMLETWMRSYKPEELFDAHGHAAARAGRAGAQGRAPHGRQPARQRRPAAARADHARLPRLRRGRAQAGRLDRRGDLRGRHVHPRRHGQEPGQLPDVRPRRDGLQPLPGDLRGDRQGLGRRGDPRRRPPLAATAASWRFSRSTSARAGWRATC